VTLLSYGAAGLYGVGTGWSLPYPFSWCLVQPVSIFLQFVSWFFIRLLVVSGYGAIGQYWITNVTEESVAVSVQWGTAMFAVSLATNSLVTLLTASRIWYVSCFHSMAKSISLTTLRLVTRNSNIIANGTSRTRSALLLLIESGAFVFAIKLIEFVLFELSPDDGINGLNALYIVFEVIPQVIVSYLLSALPFLNLNILLQGLVPTLIVLTVTARVAIGDSITARLGNGSVTGSYNGPLVFGRSSGATSTLASTQVKVHRAQETMSGHVMKSFTPTDLELGMDPKLSYHRS
jgi:hypothetical protein